MAQRREPVPNIALYNLRDARGFTQQDVADEINALAEKHGKKVHVDNVTVSRWERGIIERPSPVYRRFLAELFDVSLDELGFTRPIKVGPGMTEPQRELDVDAFVLDHSPLEVEPRVQADQDRWKTTRHSLNRNRARLARTASQLYDEQVRLSDTGLIAAPSWLPEQPIDLGSIALSYNGEAVSPVIAGTESQTQGVRPLATVANRFHRYSQALRDVDHPGLFENRVSYRLLGLDLSGDNPSATYGTTTFFESVDVNEALAHETALAVSGDVDAETISAPSMRRLPFRRLVQDPFDLPQRPVLSSIDTLTIRDDGHSPTFVLHDRSAARVAVAGGTLHIMPAGVFQPSSILPGAQLEDFDLWRNMMREYSEEFLGNEEHGGDGAPADYSTEPFATLDRARRDGRVRAYCLGVALDALTLYAEILTVVVYDADLYDELFAGMVEANDEGTVVKIGSTKAPTTAIPFDQLTIPRLLEHTALAPAAAGCLQLAWDHREQLLAR